MHIKLNVLVSLLAATVANGLPSDASASGSSNGLPSYGGSYGGSNGGSHGSPNGPPHGPPGGPPHGPPNGPSCNPPPPPPGKPSPNRPAAGSPESISQMRDKIKHWILVVMENHSFDNIFGDLTIPGISTHATEGPFCNPLNVTAGPEPKYCAKKREFDSITNDADHSNQGNNMEFYGTYTPNQADIQSGKLKANNQGFATRHIAVHGGKVNLTDEQLAAEVMDYYPESAIPVFSTLAHNFKVFNMWFSDVAGATNPNRCYLSSGTSLGHTSNNFNVNTMPQKSIFQSLSEAGIKWKGYSHDKHNIDDLFWYEYIWNNNLTDNIRNIEEFYSDVVTGNLPPYTVLTPDCCGINTQSMHPNGYTHDGERFIKSIYEVVRNSAAWEDTAILLTFDETGGFFDHVPNQVVPRPDDNTDSSTYKAPDGTNYTYHFDYSGGRLPTILISGWVDNTVEQLGTNLAGKEVAYLATSHLHTMGLYFNFTAYNPRVEYAPTYDSVFSDTFRKDTPATLPDPVPFDVNQKEELLGSF
ncbi:Non-specific phospholipase C1 [Escovopsis weberi]|uniref:Non-specific phospholipase C1 n=1 Tax=Escovopsis weberi TaxID=150374 RepID=A0A0M8MZX8_ESCWE|nr:Non-specific phospholipase C1 [Escovopsis weberi]